MNCSMKLFERIACFVLIVGTTVAPTSVRAVVPEHSVKDGVVHIKPLVFCPTEGIEDRARRDRAPYDLWVRQGDLIPLGGASMDYDQICSWLCGWLDDEQIEADAGQDDEEHHGGDGGAHMGVADLQLETEECPVEEGAENVGGEIRPGQRALDIVTFQLRQGAPDEGEQGLSGLAPLEAGRLE